MKKKLFEKQDSNLDDWSDYEWRDPKTHPKKYGKYFVLKSNGATVSLIWNNISWATNNDDVVAWKHINKT